MKTKESLEALIDGLVTAENFGKPSFDIKVALLSMVLDQLKHIRNIPDDLVKFETYVQSEIYADSHKLTIIAPRVLNDSGSGTSPIQLQSCLLIFLLLHHRKRLRILDIIRNFIEKVRPQLSYLDFKKTETGVTRCFTNTRFAAKVLRAHGLLKFTHREAFKTWELSLPGFLVAAEIFHKRSIEEVHWSIPSHNKEHNFEVLEEIRTGCDGINTYEEFVRRLASICAPDTKIFESFDKTLKKVFALLPGYLAAIKNPEVDQKNRRTASLEQFHKLEYEFINDDFYEEFAQCIQINELLAKKFDEPQND